MTANLDSKVAQVLDAQHDPEDEDALIASLEEDESSLDAFREQRLQQLNAEFKRSKEMRSVGAGTYTEIKDEKELMDITTSTKLCVVHFFKPDFNRCRIMDGHLEILSKKHFDTRFLRINVDNALFLVTKLKVQVLPCVMAWHSGISADRIVGFEGIGRSADDFTTRELEARLLRAGVLVRSKVVGENAAAAGGRGGVVEEDSGDDWD
ncbi:thioredoxin-like protein [Saccharata proteae CBS 121410]|uniref:Thioredoxin-like protein n=1 Tax=Saccharata proteae CBS 121410 TaxID=1314787 RepID=A0A9P4LZE1_9PEZI|nr:thioredoxin-like protein [Saccharata proteae CBS 121410]